jgi:hypothetical protein
MCPQFAQLPTLSIGKPLELTGLVSIQHHITHASYGEWVIGNASTTVNITSTLKTIFPKKTNALFPEFL